MQTVSLSVSKPSSAMALVCAVLSALLSAAFARERSCGAHSVQPVAISVSTKVWIKLPRGEGPLWATMSSSTNPGGGSPQSADVRIGILLRKACAVGRRRWRLEASRIRASARSIVAALIASNLARISAASSRWPCRSIASISTGINAFSRLPQTRSTLPKEHQRVLFCLCHRSDDASAGQSALQCTPAAFASRACDEIR